MISDDTAWGRTWDLPVLTCLDEVAVVARRAPVYVRYSEGPEADLQRRASRDGDSGLWMSGLSAAELSTPEWWTKPARDWYARKLCQYAELGDRPEQIPWLLTGRCVSRGPDHEPLVVAVIPLAVVGPACLGEARLRYEQLRASALNNRVPTQRVRLRSVRRG